MDPALLAATQGAQNIQSPVSSLGASQGPELAALYQSSFQLPQATQAVGAQGNIAQQQVEESKRQAAAAQAAAKQKQADLSDPNKYRTKPSKDGGYDFFDPDGNQIDIATLTQRTGTKAADWLKDSQDPTDIQYLEDSKNLNDFMNAVVSKDNNKIKTFTNNNDPKNPLTQYTNGKGGIHKLLEQFHQAYKRYYTSDWGALPGGAVVPAAQDTGSPNNAGL